MSTTAQWGDLEAASPGDNVVVRFEMRPIRDMSEAALKEGRPIFKDVEYVEIITPGDKHNIVHRAVHDGDRARFAPKYLQWKAGQGNAVSGLPLSEWPAITRGQVEELAFFKVTTVEQLAEVSDGNLRSIGPLMALKQKARDYLKAAKADAPLASLRDALTEKDTEVQALRNQLAEQGRILAGLGDAAPKEAPAKRKYTKRATTKAQKHEEAAP